MDRRSFLSAGVLTALTGRTAFAQTPAWQEAAPLPFATQEIYPAAHNGRLYLAGGIAARLGVPYFTNRCISYDPASDSWQDEPPLPEDLHHVALVSTGRDLYAIGGFNGGYTHVWRMRDTVYQLTDEGWRPMSSLPRPQAEGVATFGPTGLIHYVTGQSQRAEANTDRSDHHEVNEHLVFDPSDGRWRKLAVTEIYDPETDAWHSAAPLPLPQAGTAGTVAAGRLHIFGGEIFTPEAGVFRSLAIHNGGRPLAGTAAHADAASRSGCRYPG